LTETILENPEGKLVANGFVETRIRVRIPEFLEAPSEALSLRGQETFLPVIGLDGTLHYTKIDLVENDGKRLVIRSGVQEGERVALNVGSSLQEGQKVQPVGQAGSHK
jgi:hypothetical protein